ncbi:type I-E CRISPR-associated protein Cse1/CasA [Rubellimicrobium sp. CFH 75288]|uniref:type I-E CRISPR-associated protein Cse1/CasA n=1 Tax=Rubellimicrobium sp. CFH 75288 TaxID=2697034 RepID=UPI0014127A7F|nr:type I-E CRISPR-associated protein Cse1/CasA [Rubellimicrobium sp. CFH 75288]
MAASLNLITDPWIPVRTTAGPRTIRPDQIAEADVLWPDWPRADLEIACLELLIGLVFLADPPADARDWAARRRPDPARLHERLAPLAPAFDLEGEGPRFLQDLEVLGGEPSPPDLLFLDSAGGNTARNNADLMVRRDRYPALPLPLAAMALYAFQAFAPSGGAGNRTSLRGGGPLVTLVDPAGQGGGGGPLWDLVWANVPDGSPAGPGILPWMRPTRTSETGRQVLPGDVHPAEAFFGMPRRLRLVVEQGCVTGVIQRPHGTNYAGWRHPLTPYYRMKAGSELLPRHPRAGAFGYRNWLGTLFVRGEGLEERAAALETFVARGGGPGAAVIVAGWVMDNMKPRDFVFSRQPLVALPEARLATLLGLGEAAEEARGALRLALLPFLAEGSALEAQLESFVHRTEGALLARLRDLESGREDDAVARDWLGDMRRTALGIFDALALPGLGTRKPEMAERIVRGRSHLLGTFSGRSRTGARLYGRLGLAPPAESRQTEDA